VQLIRFGEGFYLHHDILHTEHPQSGRLTPLWRNETSSESAGRNEFAVVVTYKRLGSKDLWRIGVRIHHAMYDGVSLPVLLADLESRILGSDSILLAQDTSAFTDFAARSYNDANQMQSRRFWTAYLEPISGSVKQQQDLKVVDPHKSRIARFQSKFIHDAQNLVDTAKQSGVTLPALFLAILARTLTKMGLESKIGEQSQFVVVGVYIANRGSGSRNLESFPTLNLLPLLVDVCLPILAAARKVQQDLVDISEGPNGSVGLWQVEEWTGVRIDVFVNWLQVPSGNCGDSSQTDDRFRVQHDIDQVIEDEAQSLETSACFMDGSLGAAYEVSLLLVSCLSDSLIVF
jgi:hypothetical protein